MAPFDAGDALVVLGAGLEFVGDVVRRGSSL